MKTLYVFMFLGSALPLYTTILSVSSVITKVNPTSTEARLTPGICTVQYKQLYKCTHCLQV